MKRGVISLEALVKFIPHFVLVIVLLFGLAALYNIFLAEDQSSPVVDTLERLESIINQLSPQEQASVFTTAGNFWVSMYARDFPLAPKKCGGETCVCVTDKDGKITCKTFPGITSKECPDTNCEFQPMCFPEGSLNTFYITARSETLYACRGCTEIMITNSEDECKKHIQAKKGKA